MTPARYTRVPGGRSPKGWGEGREQVLRFALRGTVRETREWDAHLWPRCAENDDDDDDDEPGSDLCKQACVRRTRWLQCGCTIPITLCFSHTRICERECIPRISYIYILCKSLLVMPKCRSVYESSTCDVAE